MAEQARFERVNAARGVRRFHHYRVELDEARVTGDLWAVSGHIGGAGRARQLVSGPRDALWVRLRRLGEGRIRKGYRLVEFDGPAVIQEELESYERSLGAFAGSGRGASAIFHDLPRLAALLGPPETEPRRKVLALRDLLDPGCRSPTAATALPLPSFDADAAVAEHLRALAVQIADILLVDQPRARQAVRRALATPTMAGGDNVVHLVAAQGVLAIPLHQFLRGDPALCDLAFRLGDTGVRDVGGLVRLTAAELNRRFGVTLDEVRRLERLCGEWGLQLGMTALRSADQPRATCAAAQTR